MSAGVNQHGPVIDHRVPILGDAVLSRHIIIRHTARGQISANPDFATWLAESAGLRPQDMSDLLVSVNDTDAYQVLWRYVASDPKAKAFLAGEADENGMRINPYYKDQDQFISMARQSREELNAMFARDIAALEEEKKSWNDEAKGDE